MVFFNYTNFNTTVGLQLNADAIQNGTQINLVDIYPITVDPMGMEIFSNNEAGTVWYTTDVNPFQNGSFNATFDIESGPQASDGFNFALHSNSAGINLLGGASSNAGLGVGFVSDLPPNFSVYIIGNQVYLYNNFIIRDDLTRRLIGPITMSASTLDGLRVWVDYDGCQNLIEVYETLLVPNAIKPSVPTLVFTYDIFGLLNTSGNPVYVGFTSATGNSGSTHSVLSCWSMQIPSVNCGCPQTFAPTQSPTMAV